MSNEMPEELKEARSEFSKNGHAAANGIYLSFVVPNYENASEFNAESARQFSYYNTVYCAGFDKCFDLMSEREAALQAENTKLKKKLEKAVEQRNKYIKLSCAWAEECYSYESPTDIINVADKELEAE